jgi:hypothetical protein
MTQRYQIFMTTLLSLTTLIVLSCSSGNTGTGFNTPTCSVSVTALTFDGVLVNGSEIQSFVITNTGFGTLTGTMTSDCPEFSVFGAVYSLTRDVSQNVTVQFAPTAEGVFVCTLSVGADCPPVVLTGIAVATCCTVTPSALEFGSLETGSSGEATVTLKNCGPATINGTASLLACADYSITSGGGSFSITPGASHTVTVHLEAATAGEATCTLEFSGTLCDSVVCRADVGDFNCFVDPNEMAFDSLLVGESFDSVFVIRNQGTVPLIGRIIPGCDEFELVPPSNDEYNLAPGEVMDVRFRFIPDSPGDKNCFFRLVTIRGDNGEKPCSDVIVVGRGYEEDEGP